ncbi:MAG: hypothetical protein OXF46_10755 [Rhodobacteraceae bacterium]|nr:hypothetical protein [Paracoccaceae bacterium]
MNNGIDGMSLEEYRDKYNYTNYDISYLLKKWFPEGKSDSEEEHISDSELETALREILGDDYPEPSK